MGLVTPVVAFFSIWLLSALLVLLFFRCVAKWLRAAFQSSHMFGTDSRDRLFGFAVAGLVCWPVVPWLGAKVMSVFLYLSETLPKSLADAVNATAPECAQAGAKCASSVARTFTDQWSAPTSALIRDIGEQAPFVSLLLFIVIWAATAQIFGAMRRPGDDDPDALTRSFREINPVARQNALLIIVLAVATYLSLASIAAIPGLTESGDVLEVAKPERLRAQLTTVPPRSSMAAANRNPFEVLDHALGEPVEREVVATQLAQLPAMPARRLPAAVPDANGITEEDPVAAQAPDPAAEEAARRAVEEREAMVMSLKRRVEELNTQRKHALDGLTHLNASVADATGTAREQGVSLYEQNLARKGARERADHFYALASWYRAGIARGAELLRGCEQAISSGDMAAGEWARNAAAMLQRPDAAKYGVDVTHGAGSTNAAMRYDDAQTACRGENPFAAIPTRAALGGGLGPFRLVARWLLETESLSLALIVGLIGFGLLGSASSTFVREQAEKTRDPNSPLVEDLGGVMIRGVSAAVVVFLAVEGGLTILAGKSVEPNPYILLLTCLVASVFSENVWEWAREKLLESFRRKEERIQRKIEEKSKSAILSEAKDPLIG